MNEPPKEKPNLFYQPFHEWLEMVLRQDDNIKVSSDLGLLVQAFDKEERLTHVEFPSQENKNKHTYLWSIRAWKQSLENEKVKRVNEAQRKLEWDNLKTNLIIIARKYSEITTLSIEDSLVQAREILYGKTVKQIEQGFGVKLVEPYYKGIYEFMPEPREMRK